MTKRLMAGVLAVTVGGCCIPSPSRRSESRSAGRASPPAPARPTWEVRTSTSKVDDSPTVVMSITAEGSVEGWPATTVVPEIYVRCAERKTEVFFVTGMAPHVESGNLDGATVVLRFDKQAAFETRTSQSTDKKALFVPQPIPFARRMAKHDRLLFRFTPFNSPPQETEFDLADFRAKLPRVATACGWKP